MECDECGMKLPDNPPTCPNCDTPLPNSEQDNSSQNQPRQQDHQPEQQGYQSGQTGSQQQGYQSGQTGSQQPGYQSGQSQPQQQSYQPEQNRSATSILSKISIVGGILYGSVAFIISLTIHSILLLSAVSNSTSESLVDAAGEGVWYFVGWMFYNAHTVPIESTVSGTSGNLLEEIYQLAGSQISLPKITFYAIPIVVLFLLGYTLANRATQSNANPLHSAVAGSSIALGYGIFSVLGSYVFTLEYLGESASPAMGSIIVMMVIVYPVAIGGGAGYLAGR